MTFSGFKIKKCNMKQPCVAYKVITSVNIVINNFKDCISLLMAKCLLKASVDVHFG